MNIKIGNHTGVNLMMKRRIILSAFALTIMLVGICIIPSYATPEIIASETKTDVFEAAENGHVYIHSPEYAIENYGITWLNHSDDLDWTSYTYYPQYWSRTSGSFAGPAYRRTYPFNFGSGGWGWLGNSTIYGGFNDYRNTTSDTGHLEMDTRRDIFEITVGEPKSVFNEPNIMTYGVFNLTDGEFAHITIGSKHDSLTITAVVFDYETRVYGQMIINGGDIRILPFRPDGPGMYFLLLFVSANTEGLVPLDILIEEVTPTEIPVDGIVEDVLPGSEYGVESGTGSLIHDEKAPTAHTYVFSSNWTDPARLRYAMNVPETSNDIYPKYNYEVYFTADCWIQYPMLFRFWSIYSEDSDVFHYQSFQNESYYMTLIGMENTEYLLHHDSPQVQTIPINQEFYIENNIAWEQTIPYNLELAQDSVLRVNSTEGTYGYDWSIWRVFENKMYRMQSLQDASSFENAMTYYLPAGDYVVLADADDEDSWGFYEFNLGPVLDNPGAISVDLASIAAVRVPTQNLGSYNVSVEFLNHQNVSVECDIEVINNHGGLSYSSSPTLGNRQNGIIWDGYPINTTFAVSQTLLDDSSIIAISPYLAENNTAGLVSDWYSEYTSNFLIEVDDVTDSLYNNTGTMAITSSSEQHNFTLGDPGDAQELYKLSIDCPAGVWYNVSVYCEDVTDYTAMLYQDLGSEGIQLLSWSYLDDTLTGMTYNESSFQFGSISGTIELRFTINRAMVEEGVLSIEITPFTTNTPDMLPDIMYPGDGPSGAAMIPMDSTLLIVAGIAVAAVAVVVIVAIVHRRRSA